MNLIYPNRPRKRGDRYDAFRLKNVDPFYVVIPHIMTNRTGSMVFFEERIEIDKLEDFALHPGLNRFVAGRRLYARNHIALSIAVKNTMSEAGADTTVKTLFAPTDTLGDICKKLHDSFTAVKKSEENNSTYQMASLLKYVPTCFLKFFVFLMRNFDQIGLMPKAIYSVSPFHTSVFIVDIGSTGIDSIYHHLYDFGNCPVFISIGRKENTLKMDKSGNVRSVKTINFRFVVDERVCDGYYYAKAMRHLKRILAHPEILLKPLEYPVPDPLLVCKRK